MKKSGLAMHVHHAGKLFEFLWDYDERVEYILANKPADEHELRLRLMKIVPEDRIPGRDSSEYLAYTKAGDAYDKAWAAYDKARAAFGKAGDAYDKAEAAYLKKYKAELTTLHAELCPDCPWSAPGRYYHGVE